MSDESQPQPPDFSIPPDKFRTSLTPEPPSAPPANGQDPPAPSKDTVMRGFLFGLLLHLLQIPIAAITAGIGTLAIGLSQLLYMIPFYLHLKKSNQLMRAKGLMICAGITFLLNAACFGLLFLALSGADFR